MSLNNLVTQAEQASAVFAVSPKIFGGRLLCFSSL